MRKNNGLKKTLEFQEQYSEEQYHIQKNFYQAQTNSLIYFILLIIGAIITSVDGLEDTEWEKIRYWKLVLFSFQFVFTIILIFLHQRAPLHTNKILAAMSVCHSVISQLFLSGDLIQEQHSGIHYYQYGEYFIFVFLYCLRTSSFLLNTVLTIFNRGLTVIVVSFITSQYLKQSWWKLGMEIAQFSLTGVLIIYFDYRQERVDRVNFIKHMDDMVWRNTSKHIVNQSLIVSQLTTSNQIELFSCNKKASTRFQIKSTDTFTIFLKNMQLSLGESVFNSKIFEKLTFKKTFCTNLHDYLSIRHSQMLRDNLLRKAKQKSEKETNKNTNNPNQQPLLQGPEFLNLQNLNNVKNLEILENYVRQFVFKPSGEGHNKKNSIAIPKKSISFIRQICGKIVGFFRNQTRSKNQPRQQFGVSSSLLDDKGKSQEITPNNKDGQTTLTNLLDLLEDELPKDSVDVDILQCSQVIDGILRRFRVSVFKYKGGRSGEKSPLLILCIDEMLKNDFKNLKEQLLENKHFINNMLTFFSGQFKSQITLLNDHLGYSNSSHSFLENENNQKEVKGEQEEHEDKINSKNVIIKSSSQESLRFEQGEKVQQTKTKQLDQSNDLASEEDEDDEEAYSPRRMKANKKNERLSEICHLAKLITVKSLIQVNNYADCYRLKESKPLPLKISEFSISELIMNSFYFNSKPILIYNSTYQLIKSDERRLIQVIFNILNIFMRDTQEKCITFIVTDSTTAFDPPAPTPATFSSQNQFNVLNRSKMTLPNQYQQQSSLFQPTFYQNPMSRTLTAGNTNNQLSINLNYMSPTSNNFNETHQILFSEEPIVVVDNITPTQSIQRKTSLFNKKHFEKISFQDQIKLMSNAGEKKMTIKSPNETMTDHQQLLLFQSYESNQIPPTHNQLEQPASEQIVADQKSQSKSRFDENEEQEDYRPMNEQITIKINQPDSLLEADNAGLNIINNTNSEIATIFSSKSRTEVLNAPRIHNPVSSNWSHLTPTQKATSSSTIQKQETRSKVPSIEKPDLQESNDESDNENYCEVMYNENISHHIIQSLATHNNQISPQQIATNNNQNMLERISEEDKQYNNDSNQIIQSIKISNQITELYNSPTALKAIKLGNPQLMVSPPTCSNLGNSLDSINMDGANFISDENHPNLDFIIESNAESPNQNQKNHNNNKGHLLINSVQSQRNQDKVFMISLGRPKKESEFDEVLKTKNNSKQNDPDSGQRDDNENKNSNLDECHRLSKSKTEGDKSLSNNQFQLESKQINKSPYFSYRKQNENENEYPDSTVNFNGSIRTPQVAQGFRNGLKSTSRTTRFYSPPKNPPVFLNPLNQFNDNNPIRSQNEISTQQQLQSQQQLGQQNHSDFFNQQISTPTKWQKSNTYGSFRKPFWGQANKGSVQKLSFDEFSALTKKSNDNSPMIKSQKSSSEILGNSKKVNQNNVFSSSNVLTKKLNSLIPVGSPQNFTGVGGTSLVGTGAATAGTTSTAGTPNQSNILIEIQMDDENINFKSKNENEPILILATNEIVKLLGPNKKIQISENSISFHLYPNLEQRSLSSNFFAASEQFEELINLKELMNPKAVQTIQRIDRAITIDATRTCKTIYTIENKPNIFELVHENTLHSMLSLSKRDSPDLYQQQQQQQLQLQTSSNNNNNPQIQVVPPQKQLISSISRSRILTKTIQTTELVSPISQDQQQAHFCSHSQPPLHKTLTPPLLAPPPLFNLPRISQSFQQKKDILGTSANLMSGTLNNSTITQTQGLSNEIKKIPLVID